MKLVNNRYQQHMDFDKYPTYFLIIENSKEYLKTVEELYNECFNNIESDFVLSNNSEILSIQKNSLMLYDYFDLDINNKKIITEINSRVLSFISKQDFVQDFCEINKLIIDINDKIVDNFDFQIEYDSDFSYDKFIKISNYKIESQSKFIDKLMAYVKLYSSLKKIKLVIFVGLSAFLSEQELQTFVKELQYLELKCLMLEPNKKYNFNNTGCIIIDNDLCEI